MSLSQSVILRAHKSDEAKQLLVNLIKKLVEETDNDIDDMLVDQFELALGFNEKSKLN